MVPQPTSKSLAIYGTRSFITRSQELSLVPIQSLMHPIHKIPPYFSKITLRYYPPLYA